MVIEIMNGIIDQTVSNIIEPWISSGVANFSFSRYFNAKKIIAATMITVKNKLIAIR